MENEVVARVVQRAFSDHRKTLARASTEDDGDLLIADVCPLPDFVPSNVHNAGADDGPVRKVEVVRGAVDRVDFNRRSYVESCHLKAEAHASGPCEQVDSYGARTQTYSLSVEKRDYSLTHFFDVLALALPNDEHFPALPAQGCPRPPVALLVPEQLIVPELHVRLRRSHAVLASMRMPKAAVDKYNLAPSGKDQVRLAWEVPSMEPVSVTHAVNQAPDFHLQPGVLRPDPRHYLRAAGGRYVIHH